MKKLVLVLGLALTLGMNAQTVNGLKLEDVPAKYIEIVSTAKMFKWYQVTVLLDYGQVSKSKELGKSSILGEDGKPFSFNGSMGVLNLMESKGYKYISQNIITVGSQNVYHYLLENTNYNN
tara:strand:+ start:278 stop:640 length:363 start_codon:yes stop_codon:yes gene_type:complete